MANYSGFCRMCIGLYELQVREEVDHIVPVAAGGGNELENLATACRRCNRQKKDKNAAEFRSDRR